MFSYHASNPYQDNRSSLFSWLTRLLPSSKSSFSNSETIGSIVLPAQQRSTESISDVQLRNFQRRYNVLMQKGTVTTHDNAVLETMEISPKSLNSPNRYIIKFNGNGGLYQDLIRSYIQDATNLKAKVIGFNYRNVGDSTLQPKQYKELITDGIAQVQRLIDLGVNSTQILLDGHSLGGSIATKVAKHFYDKGQPIYLWNDRSFSSLGKAAAGIITPESSQSLETSFAISSSSVLAVTGWNANVASDYNAIPKDYKGYMFASKKSGDGVISHAASLHRGVKFFEKDNKISTGHKVYAHYPAHNLSRENLRNKDESQNGQEIFEEFANTHLGR